MFNISVNLKNKKKVDPVLESSLDFQCFFFMHFMSFINNYQKLKTMLSSSRGVGLHVFAGKPSVDK